MISLVSSSGERFPSGTYPCMHCKTLANFIEEDESVDCIPLPNVTSPLLDQMLKFFDDRLEAARQITCSPTLENEDMLSEAHVSFLWAHSIRYLECNSNERIFSWIFSRPSSRRESLGRAEMKCEQYLALRMTLRRKRKNKYWPSMHGVLSVDFFILYEPSRFFSCRIIPMVSSKPTATDLQRLNRIFEMRRQIQVKQRLIELEKRRLRAAKKAEAEAKRRAEYAEWVQKYRFEMSPAEKTKEIASMRAANLAARNREARRMAATRRPRPTSTVKGMGLFKRFIE
jgi:hypothetical protein